MKLTDKWPIEKFDNVLTISNGRNQKAVKDENGQYPIYGSGGIMGYANNFLCPENTVIIGRKGNINNPIYVAQKFWNVDTAFGLIANELMLNPKYLYYFCLTFNFERLNTTVTIPSLTKERLKQVKIPLPPLKTQKQIAVVLDRADALIRTRRKSIEKLDELIQSLFMDMFGDPVTNPMGWEEQGFRKVFNCTTGRLNANAAVENGQYPFFTCAQETYQIDTYAFDCKALILSGNNASGDYSVKHVNGKFNAYQRTYVLTLCSNDNSYEFFRYLLQTKLNELKKSSIGTNTKYLTMSILERLKFIVPPCDKQNIFLKKIQDIEAQKATYQKSLNSLQILFDSLMQRAFNGELKFNDEAFDKLEESIAS